MRRKHVLMMVMVRNVRSVATKDVPPSRHGFVDVVVRVRAIVRHHPEDEEERELEEEEDREDEEERDEEGVVDVERVPAEDEEEADVDEVEADNIMLIMHMSFTTL